MNRDELKALFIEAALNQDFKKCIELKKKLGDALDKPYIKRCYGSRNNNLRSQLSKRHRFMHYEMYGEKRCVYCGCQERK